MEIFCKSSLDLISELPTNIIEIILMFLPLRDAARTSILSRNWRYRWAKLPMLLFDDNTFKTELLKDSRDILVTIYEILLLHQGPISKLILDISKLKSCSEIDKVILFLSRNGIQDFTLCLSKGECHKLPSYIFSCVQLIHLSLSFCVFELPRSFDGFRKLVSLDLRQVDLFWFTSISGVPLLERLTLEVTNVVYSLTIDASNLKYLCLRGNVKWFSIKNNPLLALLSLTSGDLPLSQNQTFHLAKLFYHPSVLETLQMDYNYLKLLAEDMDLSFAKLGREPNLVKKLPTSLNYLRNLELSQISFTNMGEISFTLCLIRSCPNLQKLKIEMRTVPNTNVEPALKFLRMQDDSDISLNKLHQVQLHGISGLTPALELIKFLLARSPVLETICIMPSTRSIHQIDNKMLMELARFRRASQKAEVIFPGLDEDQA